MHHHDDTTTAAPHHDIHTHVTVSQQDIHDTWITAIETAIGYWAAEAYTIPATAYIPERYIVRERHPNDPEGLDPEHNAHAFTAGGLAHAIATIVAGRIALDPEIRCDIIRGDIDAIAADCIVQVACFGEIVYG